MRLRTDPGKGLALQPAMGTFSAAHWLVVLVVCLLIFGPSKLGSVGEGLGAAIRNFKKGLADPEGTRPEPGQAENKP